MDDDQELKRIWTTSGADCWILIEGKTRPFFEMLRDRMDSQRELRVITMLDLKTTFYDTTSGVEFTMSWDDEEQFLAATAFLDDLTGGRVLNTRGATFYVLETRGQYDALFADRQELRRPKERAGGGGRA